MNKEELVKLLKEYKENKAKLTIKLKENNQNQNYLSGKIFIAKIVVEKDYE